MASQLNDRRLHRSRQDRVLFGVCGGLGDYFAIDPVIIRLGFALITLAGGAGLLAYIILAIVLPEEGNEGVAGQEGLRRNVESLRANTGEIATDVRAGWRGPAAEGDMNPDTTTQQRRNQHLGGLILVGLGLLFIASNLGWFRWFDWGVFWPLILIGLGVAILVGRGRSPR